MRTANPTLNEKTFQDYGVPEVVDDEAPVEAAATDRMTINGTVTKTAFLALAVLVTGAFTWRQVAIGSPLAMPLGIGGAIGGLILALVTVFKPTFASVTAPLYALAEGLFLGMISAIFEAHYPGIVTQAVALTVLTLLALLGAYRSGLIKATENFKLGVVAATGSIFLLYVMTWILQLAGIHALSFIHSNGPLGIGISVVIVIVAALNLVLDFDFIEEGAKRGAPKHMEWYAAFGLMVTLIWLYLEILRLLAKLRSRD